MPIRKINQDEIQALPKFEQPVASGMNFAPGNLGAFGAIAHVDPNGGNTVFIDNGEKMTAPVGAHEIFHRIQQLSGNLRPVQNTGALLKAMGEGAPLEKQRELYDSLYGHGGNEGLKKLPSVGSLNSEQQADLPEQYMEAMQKWTKGSLTPQVLEQADQLNSAYARPMHQLANMANPSTTTINTTPQAPGPPPAALTGMIKPLPEVGGPTLYRSKLK